MKRRTKKPATATTAETSLASMLAADFALYEKILDTPGFAFHFNALALTAQRGDRLAAAVEAALVDAEKGRGNRCRPFDALAGDVRRALEDWKAGT